MLLKAHSLDYSIDSIPLLKNLNIEVAAGELVGLIGPNGAGKSTLLRLITGVLKADRGDIFYNGKTLREISPGERAKTLAYLVQGARAHWPFSVEKVVELGRLPHQQWWQSMGEQDKEKVEAALALTETKAYRNRVVTTLSGGEQTLVMLARIFATEPQIIFADEPVAALDPYHQLHVMELLRNHATDTRAGVVVLHDLSLAARFCDKLYLLNHGEVFSQGTPVEVLSDENIAQVYGVKSLVNCEGEGVSVTPMYRIKDSHP